MGVRGWQDMHSHTWKTPEGHSVLFNKQLGSWTYAIPDKQGRLKSSSIVTEIPLKKEAFTSPLEQINTTAAASAEAQGGSYYQCLGASGHIKGLVRDSSGTTALEGIEVQAGRLSGWWYGPSFENWQHWTAVTDVNGAYELEVPEGFYQLSFFDPTGTYAKKTLANEAIVHRGKTTDSMDEQLNLAGHITGYILGADTTTPPGQVTAYKNSGTDWNWYTRVSTDAVGQYHLDRLEAGEYRLYFDAGSHYIGEFYNNAQDIDSATTVTVSAGQTVPNIGVMLDVAGSISGTVTGVDGNIADGFLVEVYRHNGTSWEVYTSNYYPESVIPERQNPHFTDMTRQEPL